MATVPFEQLLHALPVVLILGTVPGLAILTLVTPRLSWPLRLAGAPGMSVATVDVIGLLLHRLHVEFRPAIVVPLLLLLCAGAVVRVRRAGVVGERLNPLSLPVTAIALGAGAVLCGVVIAAFHGQPVPPGDDPTLHASVATRIAQTHDVLPIVPIPVADSGYVRPQAALEAADALASQLGGGSPADLLLPFVLLSLLVLPLGVALLARDVLGDERVAAAAALLCLGLVFPASPIGFGGYPYIVDSTLVVPLVLGVAWCLRGRHTRTGAALVGLSVLAMWTIHGLEIFTAALVGGGLWIGLLAVRRRAAIRGASAAMGSAALAAAIGSVLTKPPVPPPSTVAPPAGPSEAASYLAGHADVGVRAVFDAFTGSDLSTPAALLLLVGVLALVLRRRERWLLVALALPLLCVLDEAGREWLHPLWMRLYPWSTNDRLLGLELFVVPVVAGVGAVAVFDALRHVLHARDSSTSLRRSLPALIFVATTMGALAIGASRTSQFLTSRLPSLERASAQDVRVLQMLDSRLPTGSVVLNHGNDDAGEWITALTHDVSAEPKAYASSQGDDWRIVALSDACADPAEALKALVGVQAVFVGSRTDVPHPWSAACIDSLPGLRLVAGSTSGAAGFAVTG